MKQSGFNQEQDFILVGIVKMWLAVFVMLAFFTGLDMLEAMVR